MKKRLGLFAIYDPDGIADDYIYHLLDELNKLLTHLIIVCNGEMSEESVVKLKEHTSDVIVRENSGYDWGAYKHVIIDFIGWEKLGEYDELVLANDTCYGPLYPFREVFDIMDCRGLDFWGITEHMPDDREEITYHVQSYFLVVGKRMLHSDAFSDFWSARPEPATYSQAIYDYELRFTKFFNECGFKSGVYSDSAYFQSKFGYNYSFWDSYRLISEKRCPLIKRKVFSLHLSLALMFNSGETARKALDYISSQLSYDLSLIWKHLIRICDVSELYNSLHLNYVFPSQISYNPQILREKKIAIIVHFSNKNQIRDRLEYFKKVPDSIDIIVSVHSKDHIRMIESHFKGGMQKNIETFIADSPCSDVAALLAECRNHFSKYEYLCLVYDAFNSNDEDLCLSLEKSFKNFLWENTLKSSEYIENVISCFENNPSLGLLSVPPHCGAQNEYDAYEKELEATVALLGLKCKLSATGVQICTENAFWCRTKALAALFNDEHKLDNLPLKHYPSNDAAGRTISSLLPLAAQHEGFYSGTMLTIEYSSLYNVTFQYLNISSSQRLMNEFIANFKKVYIYGAGQYSNKCLEQYLGKIYIFMGIIVSDGHKDKHLKIAERGYMLYEVSEVQPRDDEGIIVAIWGRIADEVLLQLSEKGYKNTICFLPRG